MKMENTTNLLDNFPDISFIDNASLEDVLTEMINNYQKKYEEITGKKIVLAKADPNRIILNACAIQVYQGYQYIDRSGKQNLLKYSYGNFLENLGALKGVPRNQPQSAKVPIRYALSEARPSVVVIPAGTRVAAGMVMFETKEYNEIPPGEMSIEITMECIQSGEIGNGFLAGEITTLVDPIPYVGTVANTETSSGGNEIESDEKYAERIFLAPAGYSVAGPEDAYIYWTKTYSPKITDVKVTVPSACVVDIRFILDNGVIPDETIIQGLEEFLNDKKKRPLTDKVNAAVPDITEYAIDLTYYINMSDVSKAISIQTKVNEAVEAYKNWQNSKIGRDINPSELIKLIMTAGAKRVVITSPVYTTLADTAVAKLTTQTITYGGLEDD